MSTTETRPEWLINSRPLWSEDDAGTYDRERIGEAWTRVFGESLFTDQAIERYDAGDTEYFRLPNGRIQVMACDGAQIRVENHVELQLQELYELRVRPTLLKSLNDRGIRTLAQLKWVVEVALAGLPVADQVQITEILNQEKRKAR